MAEATLGGLVGVQAGHPREAGERFAKHRGLSLYAQSNDAKRRSTVLESRVSKLLFVTAALAVTMSAAAAPSRASGGNAPWCAIIDYGDGGVSWECVYRSFEECYPNVIAGNKGSCNVNPYGSGPSAPAAAASRKHRKHQAQR